MHIKNVVLAYDKSQRKNFGISKHKGISKEYTPIVSFQVKRMHVNLSIIKIWNIRQNNTTKCNYRRTDEYEGRRWTH